LAAEYRRLTRIAEPSILTVRPFGLDTSRMTQLKEAASIAFRPTAAEADIFWGSSCTDARFFIPRRSGCR
jgi:hypothetical protein